MGEDAEADASGAPTDAAEEGEPRPSSGSPGSESSTIEGDETDGAVGGSDESTADTDGETSTADGATGALEPPAAADSSAETAVDSELDGDDTVADLPESEPAPEPEPELEPEPSVRPSGPAEDEEMPLADHIEEMLKRLAIVVVVAGSVTIVVFPLAEEIINFLWYSVLPGTEVTRPRVYGPLEYLLTQLKVASLAGLVVALPVFVYQSYRFMRPGLYRQERRYYLAAVPTSLVLAIVGVLFAYFIVLPAIFTYFLAYSEGAGEIAFALARTFDLILILMAYLAIVFQIPLAIMLAIMMGITTRVWLQSKRLYFWGAFLGIAFISSPDPTGMAPIIIALTMVALFEGTLLLLRWVGR